MREEKSRPWVYIVTAVIGGTAIVVAALIGYWGLQDQTKLSASLTATAETRQASAVATTTVLALLSSTATQTTIATRVQTPSLSVVLASPAVSLSPISITPTAIPTKELAEFVFVPAGKFTMGDSEQPAPPEEKPAHELRLDDFILSTMEISNKEYAKCVADGGCQSPKANKSGTRENYYSNPEFADFPVVNVNWNDATAYCNWRGLRLPTEAEWEKAARSQDGRAYPWGPTYDPRRLNDVSVKYFL